MSEMRFLMILPAVTVTLTFLHMVTSTGNPRDDPGSTIPFSIKDASKTKNITRAGVNRGLRECQRLFKNDIWNCSFHDESVTRELTDFVQTTLPYANREMAFLHAITTAGILQEIVSQCAANKITECSCNKTAWQSHACKKTILDFAVKQTKILTRSKTQGNDEQNKIDQSHKKEGIKVFKRNYRSCHGKVPKNCKTFQEIANELKKKYQSVSKTNRAQQDIRSTFKRKPKFG
ncbi:protein Wnt-4 [Pocillopora verrucosa]|uniref:protein Wnt-4 n=1 Tax=Pocillopora verrucosa TaxID=203993 RepID=UPI0027971C27|nr:protein Wnt-4-like [Pocillopora verrucosa]